MNKKSLAVAGFAVLAGLLLAGCANITDQIAKKVAETAVNQATGGKVEMSGSDGTISFKDKEGNVAQIGGGEQRPGSVPADVPSLPGASGYAWFGSADSGVFSFTVASADYKMACDQITIMLKAAGWADSASGITMEVTGSKTTQYEKPGYSLTLSCASSEGDKQTIITEAKGKKDAVAPAPTPPSTPAAMTDGSAAASASADGQVPN